MVCMATDMVPLLRAEIARWRGRCGRHVRADPARVAGEGMGGDVGQQPGGGDGAADEDSVEPPETAQRGVATGVGRHSGGAAHGHDSVQVRLSGIYP
jgi:hypothetical protein